MPTHQRRRSSERLVPAIVRRASFARYGGHFVRVTLLADIATLNHDLVSTRRRDDPLAVLSAREQEVLALMAEGRSNAGIGRRLWVTEGTVEKHVRSIMTRLNLHETGDDHRRVLAAITFLQA